MKNIKLLLIGVLLSAFMVFMGNGCVSLDEDISSILDISNLTDEGAIEASLTPIYKTLQRVIWRPQEHFIPAWGADDITTWWGGNKQPLRDYDQFNYGNGEHADQSWLEIPWPKYWKMVYYSNTLIDGLKTSTAPEDVVTVANGEAHFFRALAYLDMVRRWGNLPIILDGVVPTGKETRSNTVLDNYLQIEKDLIIAEQNLPEPGATTNIGRVSKASAKALFADLYMTWAGWPVKDQSKYALAAQKAKDIIDMGYFELLPIDKLWQEESQNSKESVFSVQFSDLTTDLNNRNFYSNATGFHNSGGYSDMYPEKQFFNDFPEGPRKDWTFYSDIPLLRWDNATQMLVPRDPATIPWQNSERKHPMYKKFIVGARNNSAVDKKFMSVRAFEFWRYAEVLLTYAEASARANGGTATGAALEALNQVKRRAMGLPYNAPDPSVDVTSATADDILQEKAWEIAGELGKRWYDLVRTEKVAEVAANRDPTEEVPLLLDPSAITWKQYIAPIPLSALLTSELTQNPEGFKIK